MARATRFGNAAFDSTQARRVANGCRDVIGKIQQAVLAGNLEAATQLEADLHATVLDAIADEYDPQYMSFQDIKRLAALALKTQEVKFARVGP